MANRRTVGHGNLAERAVLPCMPETEAFPYTTRVSAEVGVHERGGARGGRTRVNMSILDFQL